MEKICQSETTEQMFLENLNVRGLANSPFLVGQKRKELFRNCISILFHLNFIFSFFFSNDYHITSAGSQNTPNRFHTLLYLHVWIISISEQFGGQLAEERLQIVSSLLQNLTKTERGTLKITTKLRWNHFFGIPGGVVFCQLHKLVE